MRNGTTRVILVLLVALCIAVLTNIVVTVSLISSGTARAPLPCAALPTRFVMEYPHCANHLLKSMNVTNVHVQPFNESKLARPNPAENTRYATPHPGN